MRYQLLIILLGVVVTNPAYAWHKSTSTDEMTDKKSTILAQYSNKPVWNGKKAMLVVRVFCGEAKILGIMHPSAISENRISYRVDKKDAVEVPAFRKGQGAIEFGIRGTSGDDGTDGIIEHMQSSRQIIVRYEEAGGGPVTAEFNLSGLKGVLDKVCPD